MARVVAPVAEELAQAPFGSLRFLEHGFRRDDIGLGRFQPVAVFLLVEPRQHVALFDGNADVDEAGDDLAADAKAQVALVAGAHLADGLAIVVDRLGVDGDGAYGPHLRLFRGRPIASPHQRQAGDDEQTPTPSHRRSPRQSSRRRRAAPLTKPSRVIQVDRTSQPLPQRCRRLALSVHEIRPGIAGALNSPVPNR